MGLFREERSTSVEYDLPFDVVWENLIEVLDSVGDIEQKSKLGKYISFKSPMKLTRSAVSMNINLEKITDKKTKINFKGSSFGGLLQINYSKSAINEVIEKLEAKLEKLVK